MKTPFTSDQFFEVFRNYNLAVFPAQIILYVAGFVMIYLIIRLNLFSSKIISGLLAFFWLWMGIGYHLIFFTEINNAAYIFGIAFILQALLFITYGIIYTKLSFAFHSNIYGVTGFILILFALVIYPVLGYILGHVYPNSPTFGLPCPTTIFTFGVLLLTNRRVPVVVLIIPFLWALIGFTAALNFGIWEDTGLIVAGLLTMTLLIFMRRNFYQK